MSGDVKSAVDLTAEASDHVPKKGFIHVKVYTPFQEFFHGDARSISALNESGTFDILPGHHNFISMLLPYDVVVEDEAGEKITVPTRRGLMHVREDKVTVFMDV